MNTAWSNMHCTPTALGMARMLPICVFRTVGPLSLSAVAAPTNNTWQILQVPSGLTGPSPGAMPASLGDPFRRHSRRRRNHRTSTSPQRFCNRHTSPLVRVPNHLPPTNAEQCRDSCDELLPPLQQPEPPFLSSRPQRVAGLTPTPPPRHPPPAAIRIRQNAGAHEKVSAGYLRLLCVFETHATAWPSAPARRIQVVGGRLCALQRVTVALAGR